MRKVVCWSPVVGWGQEKAYECLAKSGAGDEGDDECRASKGKREDERKRFTTYSGCTGTLGSARVRLVLLLPRLRHVSDCFVVEDSATTHIARLATRWRISASSIRSSHL